jgi:hypothetical protein
VDGAGVPNPPQRSLALSLDVIDGLRISKALLSVVTDRGYNRMRT